MFDERLAGLGEDAAYIRPSWPNCGVQSARDWSPTVDRPMHGVMWPVAVWCWSSDPEVGQEDLQGAGHPQHHRAEDRLRCDQL